MIAGIVRKALDVTTDGMVSNRTVFGDNGSYFEVDGSGSLFSSSLLIAVDRKEIQTLWI